MISGLAQASEVRVSDSKHVDC